MKTLQHTVVITIPTSRCDDATLEELGRQLVSVTGGVTAHHAKGVWLGSKGLDAEAVEVSTAHYQHKDRYAVRAVIDAMTLRLLELGEEAVLIKDDDFAYVYYQSDKKGLEP